jgi:hypothetical protein
MDTPVTPNPNQQPKPAPVEQTGTGSREAALKALQGVEAAPAPASAEAAPATAADTGGGATQASGAQPAHLTRAQVAAAIAAMPGPTGAVPTVQAPAVANDQDVVEPEWVDAAEKVIAQTANNPYQEEEAFEDLQVDYLKKRYNHDVKKPDDKKPL